MINVEFSVYISGSFQKHYEGLKRKINEFEREGFVVVSPKTPVATLSLDPLVVRGHYSPKLERLIRTQEANEIDSAIRKADAFFIYNPDEYVDPVMSLKLGIAMDYNKPIFAERDIIGPNLSDHCNLVIVGERIWNVKSGILKNNFRQRVIPSFG